MATAPTQVSVAVTGDNRGAIVVGDHNTVVINQAAGAVVLPVEPVQTKRRTDGTGLGPRFFADLIDRAAERAQLQSVLHAVPPGCADLFGPPGIGKTAIMRNVCGAPEMEKAFREGVVYFDAKDQTTDDLLQQIFEAFFETDRPFKPDATQLRRFLAQTSALVALDGFLGDPNDLARLSNLAATQTFVVSGPRQALFGEGCSLGIPGLDSDDATTLIGREMGSAPEGTELAAARALTAAFDGNPLDLLAIAAHARTFDVPLSKLADGVRAAQSPDVWLAQLLGERLADRDRRALAAFAAVDCAPLDAAEVSSIAGEPAQATLDALAARRLVTYDGTRYRVAGGVVAGLVASFLAMLPAEAAAHVFLAVPSTAGPSALAGHADAVVGALKQSFLAGKYSDTLALAHHANDAVALSGRWDCWQSVLQYARDAAEATHDTAAQAWALHQLGTRALALGDLAAAQTALEAAMKLRTGLNDPSALLVTEHNLNVLRQYVPAESQAARGAHTRGWKFPGKLVAGVAVAAATAGLGTWVAAKSDLFVPRHATPRVATTTRASAKRPSATPAPARTSAVAQLSPLPSLATSKPPAPAPTATQPAVPTTPPLEPTHGAVHRPIGSQTPGSHFNGYQPKPPIVMLPPRHPTPAPAPVEITAFAYRDSPRGCLAYHVENARRAVISQLDSRNVALPSGCVSVRQRDETVSYTLVAYGADDASQSRTVNVPALVRSSPEIVRFAYVQGERSCLSYHVSNANRAEIAQLGADSLPLPSGCVSVRRRRESTTYTLTAYGEGQTSRTLTVPSAEPVTGTPEPPSITDFAYRPGDEPCLYYEVRNARSATIPQLRTGALELPIGCAPVNRGREPVTYTLQVTGLNGGRASSEVVVPARISVPTTYGTYPQGTTPYGTTPYRQSSPPAYRQATPTPHAGTPYQTHTLPVPRATVTPAPQRRLPSETPPPFHFRG